MLIACFLALTETGYAQNKLAPGPHSDEAPGRQNRRKELGKQHVDTAPGTDSVFALEGYMEGLALLQSNKVRMAGKRFKDALASDYAQITPVFREKCFCKLALVFENQHHSEEAREACLMAASIAESRSDSVAMMQHILQMYGYDVNKADNKALLQLLNYYRAHADTMSEIQCLELLAACSLYHHDISGFDSYIRSAELACLHTKNQYDLAMVELVKAEGLLQSEMYAEASKNIDTVISVCADNKFETLCTAFRIVKAECCLRTKTRIDEADLLLMEALRYAQSVGADELAACVKSLQLKLASPPGELEYNSLVLCNIIMRMNRIRSKDIQGELLNYRNSKSDFVKYQSGGIRAMLTLSVAMLLVSLMVSTLTMYRGPARLDSSTSHLGVAGAGQQEPFEVEMDEDERLVNLYAMIIDKMRLEKLYTDPEFSLSLLSGTLNRSERYVSQAIKMAGNTNFNRMVMGFRVEEACRLIEKYGYSITMNEAAVRSGFSNRMSFSRGFRELTGMSPTEYLGKTHPK